MGHAKNVTDYYVLCNKLKNIIRTGWKDWNVSKERLESVAEHIYSTQMLAIAMNSEYKYDIDLTKTLMMLAIHELGEIKIGDLTQFQIDKEKKAKIEYEAVKEVVSCLMDKDQIIDLFVEFETKETKEALFAFYCDKLECDLQAKLYGENGFVNLNKQEGNNTMKSPKVKELLNKGMTFEEMWLHFGQEKYDYDTNFLEVSNYALTHKLDIK